MVGARARSLRLSVWFGSAAAFLTSLGVARVAGAQAPSNSVAAQALFDDARRLMANGKYDEACPKLVESERLDAGAGTLLNLADCHQHQGRIATAWSEFLEAAAVSKSNGETAREQAARQLAAALTSRLSYITIDVAAGQIPGFQMTRDGAIVGEAQWGTPIPADPGDHLVAASAPGRQPWRANVTVRPGDATTAEIAVPLLGPERAASPVAASATPAVPTDVTAVSAPPAAGFGTQRTLALVAGGVGVVGVGLGTVFGFVSKSKHDDAEHHCVGSVCRDQAGVDLKSQAITAGNVATVAFIVGGVALAGGAVLWFTAHANGESQAQVGLGLGTVHVAGRF